jgi:O-antigen ligase
MALWVAVIGLRARVPGASLRKDLAGLTVALTVFVVAIAVQLVPLSLKTLDSISPETLPVLAQLNLALGTSVAAAHPLSIVPADTIRGLIVIASLAVLAIGASQLLSLTGVDRVAYAIAVIGSLLALAGIVQKPLFTGKIYGFWTPQYRGSGPFGPFVNRNHFAGWMLMGLPVTLGAFCSVIARVSPSIQPGLREKVLWLASPHGSRLLLLLGAAGIMTLSLILTTSRSGIGVAGLAGVIIAGLALRRYQTAGQKIAVVGCLCTLLVVVVGWAGAGTIANRFATGDPYDLNGRAGAWKDATRVVSLFPLAGTGLNSYGVAMVFYQQFDKPVHYLQAHNDYLQLAAEGGLLLTLPAIACLGAFLVVVRRRFAQETVPTTYWIRAGAVVGLLAIALQEIVEFSLQMPGNGFLFVVLCAMAMHRTREGIRRPAGRAPRKTD